MICLVIITTVGFSFQQRNKIVVVPVGTVFAFTQLHLTMPGAPDGFGKLFYVNAVTKTDTSNEGNILGYVKCNLLSGRKMTRLDARFCGSTALPGPSVHFHKSSLF